MPYCATCHHEAHLAAEGPRHHGYAAMDMHHVPVFGPMILGHGFGSVTWEYDRPGYTSYVVHYVDPDGHRERVRIHNDGRREIVYP